MVITKHFVFVHIPKTGGNFLQSFCERHLPEDWFVEHRLRSHATVAEIPEEYAQLPVFALIRNPWDWYVSYYHYHADATPTKRGRVPKRVRGPVYRSAFDDGRNDFKTTVTNLCNGNLEHPLARRMRRRSLDLYTATCLRIVGPSLGKRRVDVGRSEELPAAVLRFVDRHDIPVPDAFRDSLPDAPRTNMTARRPYHAYYDDELRDLVAERAAPIIRRFGYTFDTTAEREQQEAVPRARTTNRQRVASAAATADVPADEATPEVSAQLPDTRSGSRTSSTPRTTA